MVYRALPTRIGGVRYKAQFGDVRFYKWLMEIGLMPRKSLVLGAIDVPDQHLLPLVRGLLDGDGTISNFVHHPTVKTYPAYEYERLWADFNSDSRAHLELFESHIRDLIDVLGLVVQMKPRPARTH